MYEELTVKRVFAIGFKNIPFDLQKANHAFSMSAFYPNQPIIQNLILKFKICRLEYRCVVELNTNTLLVGEF